MAYTGTLTIGRTPGKFVDINIPIPFTYRILPTGGVPDAGSAVWTILGTTTGTAQADSTVSIGTYEPPFAGKIDGLNSGGAVEVGVTVDFADSQADTVTAKVKLVARSKGNGTWTVLDDGAAYTTGFAISGAAVATVQKVFSGWFKSTEGFNQVPFELGLIWQSSKATTTVIGRIKTGESVIRGEIVLGT